MKPEEIIAVITSILMNGVEDDSAPVIEETVHVAARIYLEATKVANSRSFKTSLESRWNQD